MVFKVPTSFVEAKKTKRYYTPEQQCDLDIKTSVNKIGEIINLAQVLTSLYWDSLASGGTHEENFELYKDICTLSVLSGIEIDKAKKEFDIDSTKELTKLRKKYEAALTDASNNKKILPHFFSHIAREKGYYNPDKKSYLKHYTSMDFLQTIINSFRISNRMKEDPLPLSCILDSKKYYKHRVNDQQIEKIKTLIETYLADNKQVFSSDIDSEEKHEMAVLNRERLIENISAEKIGFSTMFFLLNELEFPENKKIKHVLLNVLFTTNNESFYSAILKSVEPVEYLKSEDGDIEIYGQKYKKLQKNGSNVKGYGGLLEKTSDNNGGK